MISHIVLMKLNGRADQTVIGKMQAYAARIRDQIGEVRAYQLVPNLAAGNGGYNWAILSAFETEADIEAYKVAPLHREFVDYCDPYTDDFLTLDYRAPAAT